MRNIIYIIIAIIVILSLIGIFLYKVRVPVDKEVLREKPEEVVEKREEVLEKEGEKPVKGEEKEKVEAKIKSENPMEQSEGIEILKDQGGLVNARQLEEVLESPHAAVVMEAVSALGSIGGKESVEKLEDLYQESRIREDGYGVSIREEIIDALGNIKDEGSVDFLGKEFNSNESLMFKEHLLDALDKIGSKQGLPYLEGYLKNLEKNPVEDNVRLNFLVDKAKERTEEIIRTIKNKE